MPYAIPYATCGTHVAYGAMVMLYVSFAPTLCPMPCPVLEKRMVRPRLSSYAVCSVLTSAMLLRAWYQRCGTAISYAATNMCSTALAYAVCCYGMFSTEFGMVVPGWSMRRRGALRSTASSLVRDRLILYLIRDVTALSCALSAT
eukprot:2341839-Rhodomonas_salina.1